MTNNSLLYRYEATKALYPWVCDSSFARSKCPFGCGVVPTCAEDAGTEKVPIHNIFDRIMLMKRQETSSVNAVLCARQGYVCLRRIQVCT